MSDTQPKIFLSYRRADSRCFTERLHDRLVMEFGEDNLFLDVERDNIQPGKRFPEVLQQKLKESDIVLVVIGPDWADIRYENVPDRPRRLDDPNDFVRIEVEQSLRADYTEVIPVLVKRATMPNLLPDSLEDLKVLQAKSIGFNPVFHRDVDQLISNIRTLGEDVQKRRQTVQTNRRRMNIAQRRQFDSKLLRKTFAVSTDTVKENAKNRLTLDQRRSLPDKPKLWLIPFGIVYCIVVVSGFLTIEQSSVESIEPYLKPLLPVFTALLMLVGLLFIFNIVYQAIYNRRRAQSVKGKLRNVHIKDKRVEFEINGMWFTLDVNESLAETMRKLRYFEGKSIILYYYLERPRGRKPSIYHVLSAQLEPIESV